MSHLRRMNDTWSQMGEMGSNLLTAEFQGLWLIPLLALPNAIYIWLWILPGAWINTAKRATPIFGGNWPSDKTSQGDKACQYLAVLRVHFRSFHLSSRREALIHRPSRLDARKALRPAQRCRCIHSCSCRSSLHPSRSHRSGRGGVLRNGWMSKVYRQKESKRSPHCAPGCATSALRRRGSRLRIVHHHQQGRKAAS